ncbi:MAG: SAM-dependent chlorinase/fluorinase [Chloroflexota bacterium]|nr:SAM-dependent chlorinase/fluorinase [Chloroflexota bacterium]
MAAIITLTTDFGLTDAYVAEMKGVILGINPEVRIVDICHSIRPQDISQAAFVLGTACKSFPRGTVHVVVVDPGVGSERRAIILRTPRADFVAPDNGVLSYVIQESSAGLVDDNSTGCRQVELEPGLEAVAITRSQFWRSPVSPTFHGRDIFAPVAARLSLGFPPADFGEEVTSVRVLPLSHPYRAPDGALVGHIIHVDGFGNLITDIKDDDLPRTKEALTVSVGGRQIPGLSRTYAGGEGLLALIGGSGHLEISVKEGSASTFLGAGIGDEVRSEARCEH